MYHRGSKNKKQKKDLGLVVVLITSKRKISILTDENLPTKTKPKIKTNNKNETIVKFK
jgi:hypothetical protein